MQINVLILLLDHLDDPHRKGYGHAQHVVYNMRVECEFRFYRQVFDKKGSYYYVLAGTSNRVTFDGGAEEPLQVRVM